MPAGKDAPTGGMFDIKQLVKDAIGALPLGGLGTGIWAELMKTIPGKIVGGVVDWAAKAVGLGGDGPLPQLVRDRGGWIPTGPSVVHNNTGRGEYVLSPTQVDELLADRAGQVLVQVTPDHRGFSDLIRVVVREELAKPSRGGVVS